MEFCFEIDSNLNLDIDECENIRLKLRHADLLLGIVYRHPQSNVKLFTDQLNKRLEQLKVFTIHNLFSRRHEYQFISCH